MLKVILLILACSLTFVFSLTESIEAAVKDAPYTRWAVAAAVSFPLTIFLICTIFAR